MASGETTTSSEATRPILSALVLLEAGDGSEGLLADLTRRLDRLEVSMTVAVGSTMPTENMYAHNHDNEYLAATSFLLPARLLLVACWSFPEGARQTAWESQLLWSNPQGEKATLSDWSPLPQGLLSHHTIAELDQLPLKGRGVYSLSGHIRPHGTSDGPGDSLNSYLVQVDIRLQLKNAIDAMEELVRASQDESEEGEGEAR